MTDELVAKLAARSGLDEEEVIEWALLIADELVNPADIVDPLTVPAQSPVVQEVQ